MELLKAISAALQSGDTDATCLAIRDGLMKRISAGKLLEEGLLAGMNVIGTRFKAGEIYIPEVLRSARAMNAALAILEPHLAEGKIHSQGTIVIGTVQGDMHNIGKSLASIMFRGAGFDICDLGVNVSPDRFLTEVNDRQPRVVGLSAMLTTTMLNMAPVVEQLKRDFPTIPVVIGGAPTSREFADSIGADFYARSAM
ncbi:MAG: cobalamin-binding protein, partial [FCB group bacterium]|nr:cobalamin-binding protein [FCB group bacterium]